MPVFQDENIGRFLSINNLKFVFDMPGDMTVRKNITESAGFPDPVKFPGGARRWDAVEVEAWLKKLRGSKR